MTVYFASSITHASDELKQIVSDLLNQLKTVCEINEYVGGREATPREVYLHDKGCIDNCELVIAEVSEPSLGVGYEIGYALSLGKKVYAFGQEGKNVTRMIRGISDPNFSFQTYKNPSEVIEKVKML